uniref:C2H2-type domain-containing protein n=2 Tax=Kalanchoe fedtschenkoi TaxID=63787 RepID=A0A7N0SYG1_KALFE
MSDFQVGFLAAEKADESSHLSMESGVEPEPVKTPSKRHRCAACFKQYKRKDHLIWHMKTSYHSVHQPKCGVCEKHCKSFESLREHLTGPLPKGNCSKMFAEKGCDLCMKIFDSSDAASTHKEACRLPPPVPIATILSDSAGSQNKMSSSFNGCIAADSKAVAMDCEMVGGGSDESVDICARVCLVDDAENLVFHAYVQPASPVTNYRHEVTGLTAEHLQDAMPLEEVQAKIKEILYNGEILGRVRMNSGKARLLVGHDLEHDLESLGLSYPDHLLRDTAKYPPLMKTNLLHHSSWDT